MNKDSNKLILYFITLILAGVSPNLFPISQTGVVALSDLIFPYLIPSAILIFLITGFSYYLKYNDLAKEIVHGIWAGIVATLALEIVREAGFRLGGMPGDMPKLLGVLILNRFADGPDFWSNLAGWTYHFWNGACFGIIYSLLAGRGKTFTGIIYGILIGIGFMISPVTRTLGIGMFGFQFKDGYQFITTVTLAHIAYGAVLGYMIHKSNKGLPSVTKRITGSLMKMK